MKYSDDDYGAKQQTEAQDSLLAEVEKEQLTESLNANCRLRLNLSEDTLKFELKNSTESGEGYDAEFIYPKFSGESSGIHRLNKELELLVFDELPDSKAYFSKYNQEYIEEFKGVNPAEKYNWSDLEEIELIINSKEIVSAIHHDFELKSGGAIFFGKRIGVNFDIVNEKEITFEELFDKTKSDILQLALVNSYKDLFEVESLKENGWDKEEIPISENFVLEEDGITFIYQRFQYSGVSGGGMDLKVFYCQLMDLIKGDSKIKEKLK